MWRHNLPAAVLWFLALFSFGLAAGVVLTHLLQAGPKAALDAETYLAIQQGLLRNYGPALGIIESTALLASLTLAWFVRERLPARLLTLAAAGCVAVMILIWALFLQPINATIAGWDRYSMPLNFDQYRDRWALLHTLRAAFAMLGFAALTAAAILEQNPPPQQP